MSLSSLKEKLLPLALREAPTPPPPATAAPAASADAASPAPALSEPVPLLAETDHAQKGCDLDVTVPPARLPDAAQALDEEGWMLESITGVDWLAAGQIEVVYDFTHFGTGKRVTLRTRAPREKPEVPTISHLHPGANWHERETRDFFGVWFTDHEEMLPLLLPEDADFHPLRKDFRA